MSLRTMLVGLGAAGFVAGIAITAPAGAVPVQPLDQKGYDAVACNADTVYIYKYERTNPDERLDALPRGAMFHVYHNDGGWDFGVRNYNSVSGHVLHDKLCPVGSAAAAAARSTRGQVVSTKAIRNVVSPNVVHPNVVGERKCVTSPTLYIRNYPAGRAIDQLYHGQSFSVYEARTSGWSRGYAYGHINSDSSGEAPPNDNLWTQSAYLAPYGSPECD